MCNFDKNRWVVQNRDKLIAAAHEGKSVDSIWVAYVAKRLVCGVVVAAWVVIAVVGVLTS